MRYDQKEAFGRLFRGYVKMIGNPQSEHRNEAAAEMTEALGEFKASGTSFDELAADKEYQKLVMTTDAGMQHFVAFIHGFMEHGYDDAHDMSDIVDEQIHIAEWVNAHRKELIR